MIRSRRVGRGERGFTLVELLLVVFVLGLIGAMTVVAFTSGQEALGRADDDSRGQQDLRTVSERLSRDIRAGRGVADGSNETTLKVWVDTDADYVQDAAERITWALAVNPNDAKHFNVTRTAGACTAEVIGEALVSGIAFAYDNAVVTRSRIVTVRMTYDAIVDAYLAKKETTFRIRMRNVE